MAFAAALAIGASYSTAAHAQIYMFAVVNSNGTLARGKDVTSSGKLITGGYAVIFNKDVSKCVYVATIGSPTGKTVSTGEIRVALNAQNNNSVIVGTTNSSGTDSDRPFHLLVICNSK